MKINRMLLLAIRGCCFLTIVLGLLAGPGDLAALANHPFHVCVGQMRWNPESSKWEVSLRMHPRDLELTLADLHKKSIGREDQDFSTHAIEFLENQFFLFRSTDTQDFKVLQKRISDLAPTKSLEQKNDLLERRSRLEWVGMESERGWLWIHLELIPPQDTAKQDQQAPLYLVHRIFLDRIDAQENSVAIHQTQSDRRALQFKKGQAVKPFEPVRPNP